MVMEEFEVEALLVQTLYNAVRANGKRVWDENAKKKAQGEKRILVRFPDDPRTSWSEWKKRPGVFGSLDEEQNTAGDGKPPTSKSKPQSTNETPVMEQPASSTGVKQRNVGESERSGLVRRPPDLNTQKQLENQPQEMKQHSMAISDSSALESQGAERSSQPEGRQPAQALESQPVDKSSGTRLVENVSGVGCYRYGRNETLSQARRAATSLAQEQAVRGHHVFVQSKQMKKFSPEEKEDLIAVTSAAILEQVRVEKEEQKAGQEICVTISAKLSTSSVEEVIRQRIIAKEIANEAQKSTKSFSPGSGLAVRVWTNKPEGRFIEGERLIIYVMPDRDGYLKLDYFQADGKVVHFFPRPARDQERVKAGQTHKYDFAIQAPFGSEIIKATVSNRPFELRVRPIEDSEEYLKELSLATIRSGAVTMEQSVSLVTVSKTEKVDQETRK